VERLFPPVEPPEAVGVRPDSPRSASAEPRADPAEVRSRALLGILSLGGREAAGKLLGLAGGIVLARLLEPAAFGLFAMATVAVAVLAFLNDVGLGTALIRQAGDIAARQLDAVFTFHLVLVSILAVALFLAAPIVARGYQMPDLTWLLRALTGLLVLRSLRTVPVIIAERRLAYRPLALAEFAGQVAYWLVAVAAALAGLDVWSLVLAVTALAAVEAVALYRRTEWRPRLSFDWSPVRDHASFGLLYKGHTAAAFVKDTLFPALGGFAFGSVAVGYLTWAQQIAVVPLALTNVVSRVSYPALARLQHDREAFGEMVATTLKWTCRFTFPALAVLGGLAPGITQLVYGPKWMPALPALYLLVADAALAVSSGVLRAAIYSQGRAGPVFKISLTWMLVTWITAAGLVAAGSGFVALAAASALGTALALAMTVWTVRDLGAMALARGAFRPAVSGVGVGILLHLTGPAVVHGVASLAMLALAGAGAALVVNVWDERSAAWGAARRLVTRSGRPSGPARWR
jgi:O-antigen/teichoic acid export membrane protein